MNSRPLLTFAVLILMSLGSLSVLADSLRCGSQLASVGDRAFEVERKCGAPIQRSSVGYSHDRQALLEEWVYGPNNGMYYILTFDGGRLVKIESRRS